MAKKITIPYKYIPRIYQIDTRKAREGGCKRVVKVWHRRAGKDRDDRNNIIDKAWFAPGLYFYVFPTQQQARKVIWNGMDIHGFRYIDHIPEELTKRRSEQLLSIEMINGSIIQLVGTELGQIDRLVGSNPLGVQFSEYSLTNPRAWDLIRPILAENGGRAGFNFTPRGRNHAYDLYNLAKDNENRHVSLLTVDDTKREDGSRVVSQEALDEELKMGMDYDVFLQEYYCSFDASIQGSYYSKQFKKAEEEKRFTVCPYEVGIDVHTIWDIGVSDATSIIFVQIAGKEVRIIDYLESSGEGVGYYIGELKKKGYIYGTHNFPHDAEIREFTTGKSRIDTIKEMGMTNIKITPKLGIQDGIDLARSMFARCVFDKEKCKYLMNCLREYHKEYDEKRKVYKNHPEHDRSSHGADAFRYLAVVLDKLQVNRQQTVYQAKRA